MQTKTIQVKNYLKHILSMRDNYPTKDSLSILSCAENLNTNRRTLQRHLSKEGTGYFEILDNLRKEYSKRLLQSDFLVTNVSAMLGFSDRTSYTNAHIRWYQVTPSRYQKDFRKFKIEAMLHEKI